MPVPLAAGRPPPTKAHSPKYQLPDTGDLRFCTRYEVLGAKDRCVPQDRKETSSSCSKSGSRKKLRNFFAFPRLMILSPRSPPFHHPSSDFRFRQANKESL